VKLRGVAILAGLVPVRAIGVWYTKSDHTFLMVGLRASFGSK